MALGLAGPNTRVVLAGDHMQMGPKLFSVDDHHRSDHTLLNRSTIIKAKHVMLPRTEESYSVKTTAQLKKLWSLCPPISMLVRMISSKLLEIFRLLQMAMP